MSTYVLVHGAWSGAHGFRKVRPLLQAQAHAVFTPSLTGIGERVHLTGAQVNLTTHVQDVVNTILYEDLTDIVLLGFSYGGMVVTGALDRIGDRVRHLVYLDAFVPSDGESVNGILGRPAPITRGLGDDWLVPAMPRTYDDPAEGVWAEARRVPHPAACFADPVRLSRPLEEWPFSLTYIKATEDAREAGGAFWPAGDRANASPRWHYAEVDTNHMIPNNRPGRLAELLLALT